MPIQRNGTSSGRNSGPRISTRRRNMIRKKRRMMAIKVGIIFACLLVAYGILQFSLYRYVSKNAAVGILNGVFIGDTDVSGMTKKQATEAVEAQTAVYQAGNLTMKLDDTRTAQATYQELGLAVKNQKALIQEACDYGKKGSLFKRYRAIKSSKKKKHTIAARYAVDANAANAMITERCKTLLTAPVNASITRSGEQSVITEGKPGEVIDLKASVKAINKLLNDDWHGDSIAVTLSDNEQEPEITAQDLKGIQDLLGTYTTYYNADGTAHAQNVEQGATNIGGTLVLPGKECSANDTIGPEDEAHGFAKAGSYENGTVVETLGGGVCQVSTTLYNAILYAELEIVQRDTHSMLVAYVEPSRDAAIADDVKDLVFKNNMKTPVYIESVLDGGYLTFNVYGKETRDAGRRVEFESEILHTEDAEGVKFVATDKPVGSFVMTSAYQGTDAQLWKVVYQNEEEVSREVINMSHYQATPVTYGVGTTSDNPEAAAAVSNAIASQDEATIRAAINTAFGYEAVSTNSTSDGN